MSDENDSLHEQRRLHWDRVFNARDLGGLPTEQGRTVRRGAFVRTDTLNRLTDRGQRDLAEFGVRTIIDLRRSAEAETRPVPFAIRHPSTEQITYLHLPFFTDAEAEIPGTPENVSVDLHYCYRLDQVPHRVGEILRAMAEAPEGAVLFHCHSGKDRTGIIAVLLLALAGVPDDLIAQDYAISSAYLAPADQAWIEEDPALSAARREELHTWGARPERAYAILRHLRAHYGGVEGYLRHAGLTDAQISSLRARLLAPLP